jgi:hypothetical protein
VLSLTLSKEQGAEEGEDVVGGWRRLHSEELHNLYASPNIMISNKG